MTASTLLLILVSVTMSAVAQISFKFGMASASARQAGLVEALFTPGVMAGLALYGLGTLLWLSVLSRIEVSQAYPFVGLGFVLTAILGHLLFNDAIGPQRILGIFVVVGGIVLVARS